MLNPKVFGTSSFQAIVQDANKGVNTLGVYEDIKSNYKGIFIGYSINSMAFIVFTNTRKILDGIHKCFG